MDKSQIEDKYYSFVFRGLLAEESLDKSGRKKKMPFSEEYENLIASRLSLHIMDEDKVKEAKKMSIVYTAICSFENSVREFIKTILIEEFGESWWKDAVSEKVRKKAEKRRDDEEKIRWHTPRGDEIVNFTEFGDLSAIINTNWALFEPYLFHQQWAHQILICMERSRNVIMHSGMLEMEDIERIGTYLRDWIKQVGI